jgi:hypothetical protein
LSFAKNFSVALSTDASANDERGGYGGFCQIKEERFFHFGRWSDVQLLQHINELELRGALKAIQCHLPRLRGKGVVILTDSVCALFYLIHGGGRIAEMSTLAKEILLLCAENDIDLTAVHKRGFTHAIADALSRFVDKEDWTLSWEAFQRVEEMFGERLFDLMATAENARCKDYFALSCDEASRGQNAFRYDWGPIEGAYLNAPFSLIGKVLRKIRKDKAKMVIVVPDWPAASWWPLLLEMEQGRLVLGRKKGLFVSLRKELREKGARWDAVAFLVDGAVC